MPLFRYPRFLGPFLLIDCQNSEREIYRDKEEDKREGLGFRRAVSVKKKKGGIERDREKERERESTGIRVSVCTSAIFFLWGGWWG